ncbi:MAG TPA: hypothetical protein VJN96_25790 [Vicinamibacterales bacterium]|nr:hypothetical protein [Vicinamibacterales bacterium]
MMQYSGVCLLRQYSTFAGIVHGQKTCKFFAKLVSRKLATAYACRHNRGRVYHVHHKALYRAIGETDSPHRRPLSPDQIIQGLATLDAVLTTPTIEYLATADDRARRLSVVAHLFRDKHPVGVDPDGRVVLLYVATEACSHRFLAFLQRQQTLLRSLPTWTLRIVVPSWPLGLDNAYLKMANPELSQVLSRKHVERLRAYFEQRRAAQTTDARPRSADLDLARRAYRGERFELLYRGWLIEGDSVLETASSPHFEQALKDGRGRIESVVLPHQYRHLSLLVALENRRRTGAEKGEMAVPRPRPHSSTSSPLAVSAITQHNSASTLPSEPLSQ